MREEKIQNAFVGGLSWLNEEVIVMDLRAGERMRERGRGTVAKKSAVEESPSSPHHHTNNVFNGPRQL